MNINIKGNEDTIKKINQILEKYWIAFIYLAGVIVQVFLSDSQQLKDENGIRNLIITIVFFLIIAGIFFFAFQDFKKSIVFRNDIKKASARILELHEQGETDILSHFLDEEIFTVPILKEAYLAYKEDIQKMTSVNPDVKIDIENYLNQDLLEENMATYYLNQIPGAMTGLGIFGTFLGLSLGLSGFELKANGDVATEIQPLMNGIKVAFHTSIIGLIYSLSFNFCYRHHLDNSRQYLNEFLENYHKYVVTLTEDGSESTMYKYQKQIVDLLSAQIVGQTQERELQNNQIEIMSQMSQQMVNEIMVSLNDAIVPEIRKMATAVDNFALKTQKDQSEELERIVNNFVEMMNTSLGDSFASLGQVIAETNEWQKHSLEEMQAVLAEINTMAADLTEVNKTLAQSIDTMSAYAEKVSEYQDGINSNMMSLNVQADRNNELINSQAAILATLSDQSTKQNESMKQFLTTAAAETERLQSMGSSITVLTQTSQESLGNVIANLDGLSEKIEQQSQASIQNIASLVSTTTSALRQQSEECSKSIHDMTEAQKLDYQKTCQSMTAALQGKMNEVINMNNQVATDLSEATRQMTKAANDMDDHMQRQIQESLKVFDEELAKAVSHLSGTIRNMDDTTKKLPVIVNGTCLDLDEQFKEMQHQLDEYLKIVSKLHHDCAEMYSRL